jgi:dipeptidyl aminopeptidase/acylaminoacyl peptidase
MQKKFTGRSLMLYMLVAGSLVSLSYPAAYQVRDQSKFFTAEDYFEFEWISDPQISPDGKKIVYVRNFADISSDVFYSNLWTVNFTGSDHRPLTSGLVHDGSPRWSPDSRTIIYTSDRNGKPQVIKRWMETGETVMLSNLFFPPSGISWSPDGGWIAFSAPVPSKPRTIAHLLEAQSGGPGPAHSHSTVL